VPARALTVVAGATILAASAIAWLGGALADDDADVSPVADAHPLTIAAHAGRHVRIDGPHGTIHVWIPPGYRAETGATVVYVHGYWDDADSAFTGHHLPEQFAMSALNAMFVVPEAPSSTRDDVNYPSLGELLRIVEDRTGVTRGMALTAVVGHSGAYRTVNAWLDEPLVDEIVLVDAMYGNEEEIKGWYRASPHHRLVTIGEDTLPWNEQFAHDVPETYVVDWVPPTYDTWPPRARTARAVYVRAQYGHMPLVMEGVVLPAVLRLLPVELLGTEPWQYPLGALPQPPDAAIDGPPDVAPADGATDGATD